MLNIYLKSDDGQIFEVDVVLAKISRTIKSIVDDLEPDDWEEPIPLPNISSNTLRKIIQWIKHHKDDPELPDEEEDDYVRHRDGPKRTDDIPQWDMDFLNVDQETLYQITTGAHYLKVKGLLNVCCKTIANMIKGKSPEELRVLFGMTSG